MDLRRSAATAAALLASLLGGGLAAAGGSVSPDDCLKAPFDADKAELIITSAKGDPDKLRLILAEANLPCLAQLQVESACLVQVDRQSALSIRQVAERLQANIFALKANGPAPKDKQAEIGKVIVNLDYPAPVDPAGPEETLPGAAPLGVLDPRFDEQLELKKMDAHVAWIDAPASTGVTTAIIDTGIFMGHEDLAGQFDGGISIGCHGQVCDGSPNPLDPEHHHGTRVAGIIAATKNNEFGGAGVAWNTRFISIYYGPRVTQYRMSCALQYAIEQEVDIVNASWTGGQDHGEFEDHPWDVFERYVEFAEEKGILIVFAAGNEGADLDKQTHYPLNLRRPNMLAVMEFDVLTGEVPTSNFGHMTVQIAAPHMASLTTCLVNASCYTETEAHGSSWSAAYVSGAAALLKSHNPQAGYDFLKWRILANATQDEKLSGKNQSGGYLDLVSTIYPVSTRRGVLSRRFDTAVSWKTGIRADMCASVSIEGRTMGAGGAGAYIQIISNTPNDGEEYLPHGVIAGVTEPVLQLRIRCLNAIPTALSLPLPLVD